MNRAMIIRITGIISAIIALTIWTFNVKGFIGQQPKTELFLFYLTVAVLPSFIVVFLIIFGRFWWAFCIGLWLLFLAIMTACQESASSASMLLVIATAMVCTIPFLHLACRYRTKSSPETDATKENVESINSRIEDDK